MSQNRLAESASLGDLIGGLASDIQDLVRGEIALGRSELEQKLDPKTFFRIHRSTLVNMAWIKELSPLPGGGLNARLKDVQGTDLTVARDRAREFKARLDL